MAHLPLVDGNDIPLLGLASFRRYSLLKSHGNRKLSLFNVLRRDSEEEIKAIVNKFLGISGNLPMKHLEISELYGNGRTVLNAILASGVQRSEIYLTFKVWPKDRSGPEIITAIVENLDLLGLEYFDLILIQSPIDLKHKFDQWSSLEVLKEEGYTKSIGVSNFAERQIVELMKFCQVQPAVLEVKFLA